MNAKFLLLLLLGVLLVVTGILTGNCGKVFFDTDVLSGVFRYECHVSLAVSPFFSDEQQKGQDQ